MRALKKLEFEASYLLMYMKSTQTLDKRIELKNHMELKIDAMRGNGMKTVSRGQAWCSSGKKGKLEKNVWIVVMIVIIMMMSLKIK